MSDGSRLTSLHTGWTYLPITRPARGTTIPDLFTLFMLDGHHGFLTEDIKFIWADFKDFDRTSLHTFSTTVAFLRINDDEPVTGAIFKTIIGNHVLPLFRLEE
jgi:hypothetical protein